MQRWVALLGMTALAASVTYSTDGRPPYAPQSNLMTTIPFELASDFLVVVKARIGELQDLRFIVDTGATHSAIDRAVAHKLGLRPRAGKVINFDRDMAVEWADIPDLQFGPLRSGGIPVMVMRLAEYSEFAKKMDGIIGLDLLSKTEKVFIDYERRTLSIQPAAEGTAHVLSGCLTIPFLVQGTRMNFVVDTGQREVLLYRERFRERSAVIRTQGKSEEVTFGRLHAIRVILPGVQISGPSESLTVLLIESPSEKTLPGIDGYVGPASLHAKRIEFDFAAHVLRWQAD